MPKKKELSGRGLAPVTAPNNIPLATSSNTAFLNHTQPTGTLNPFSEPGVASGFYDTTSGFDNTAQGFGDEASMPTQPTNALPTFFTSSAIQEQDVSRLLSPNSSPPSVPTETPATTPSRPPVQRLDSLGVPGRGGFGTGRVMAGKIKPKAVRRGFEEREKAQREEQERRRERESKLQMEMDIDKAESSGGLGRGLGRGDRGRGRRGAAMGKELDKNAKTLREASGLFGVAPAAIERGPASVLQGTSATRRTAASGNTGIGTQGMSNLTISEKDPASLLRPAADGPAGGNVDTKVAKIKLEPIYPDEREDDTPRINVEHINLVTDDEDNEDDIVDGSIKGKGKERVASSKRGLRPVRVERVPHRERVAMVNTEPASITLTHDVGEPGQFSDMSIHDHDKTDPGQYSRGDKKWLGALQDDDVEMKYDPIASTNIDTRDKTPRVSTRQPRVDDDDEPTIFPPRKNKPKPFCMPSNTAPPVLRTEEDRAEYQRFLKDRESVANEILSHHSSFWVAENDAGTNDSGPKTTDEHRRIQGPLYLFQLPPNIPPLISKKKADDLKEVMPPPITVKETTSPAQQLDPNEVIYIDTEEGPANVPLALPDIIPEEGFVGKLIVRESGSVELDWGGMTLLLTKGTLGNHLTTAVVLEGLKKAEQSEAEAKALKKAETLKKVEQDEDEGLDAEQDEASTEMGSEHENTGPIGTATGLGRVMGKFIATPDWDELFEKERQERLEMRRREEKTEQKKDKE